MIRFIHTADWQIGMKASGLGSAASRVREVRLATIRRVVALAEERQAELILVAGDVFEDNAVDRLLVRQVGEALGAFRGQVFIIPGNHDPLIPGSVWEHSVWEEFGNVTVIREATPVELEHCALYPCPLTQKYSTRNPASWINADKGKIAIGIAHGTVEGMPGMEPDHPIPRDWATRAGLDYLAIGHWHSFATYPDAAGAVRMAYCGSHETTKFGERDSGNVLLVEIAEPGAAPQVESLPVGTLQWHALEFNLDHERALQDVEVHLQSIEEPKDSLVRLRLSGLIHSQDHERLVRLEEIVQTRFLFGMIDTAELIPAPEDESWVETLPAGHLREAAQELLHTAQYALEPRQKTVATQALLHLFALNNERTGS